MRDQQNPSTSDLHQPLLFAPSELLACGLRDAHHHPLVGVRSEDGVRSWRTSPATAWENPLVEWARTANSYCSIVLDCDSRESQELACAVEAGYGYLPRPNVAAQRASSGHLHLGWNLRTPVHRGAASRPQPLAALGRIAEYYAVTLRSDRGYVGVLAYLTDPCAQAIASVARRLVELRDRWLNPPEWVEWVEEPVPGYPPRPVPRDKKAATALKKRTLTNLYNARPQWLGDAHNQLDAAVAAVYGWSADITDDAALKELLARNGC